jgi:hypothetical protein
MRSIVIVLCVVAVARADEREASPTGDDPVAGEIAARFTADAKARASALALYRDNGSRAELGDDEIMDGGYRGKIHLVPQLPIGRYRTHVAWIASAMRSIDAFFVAQFASRDMCPASSTAEGRCGSIDGIASPPYRWRDLAFRFVRSVGKHTPSAYATRWSITYNVEGSLLTSELGVRETVFHELFHLNDEGHGDWSAKRLTRDYDAIVAKCGTKTSCLAAYAPNDTMVRGGTYYAFQQHNGNAVHEYAAEIAVRYFKEQSEMRARGKLARKAFKCGPAENARAWHALVDEFFAGVDHVPTC